MTETARCKVTGCTRPLKSGGLCHLHLKDKVKPRAISFGGSDFSVWQKRQNLEKSWRKEVTSTARTAEARRIRTAVMDLATPVWLSDRQKAEIAALYAEARRLSNERKEKYAVDHIVPLQGDGVNGLHVPWNLRVVLSSDNNKKNNRMEE